MSDTATTLQPYESEILTRAKEAGIDLRAMLDEIPETADDGYLNIVIQLANARSIDDLDAPWSLDGLSAYEGQWLEVRELRRAPSDYQDGLGLYLLLSAMVVDSGEIITVSTGSVNVVMQLVRARALGVLPLTVRPLLAKKPSKAGYKPMHLEVRHTQRASAE